MNKVIEVFYYYLIHGRDSSSYKKTYLNISSIESFCDLGNATSFEYYSAKYKRSFCAYEMKVLIISVSGEYYFSKSSIDKFVELSKVFDSIGDRFEILDL